MINFAFLLGVVFITFNLIWVFFTFVLKTTLGETGNIEKYILRVFQGYFLASVTALATINYELNSGIKSRVFLITGIVVLFLYLINKIKQRERRLQFSMQLNRNMINFKPKNLKYDLIIAVATVALFVVSYLNPETVQTSLNIWIFAKIESISNAFLIGWVIGIIGVFFIIGIFFNGINSLQIIYSQLSNYMNGNSKDKNDEDDFTDFEFVEEDDKESNLIE